MNDQVVRVLLSELEDVRRRLAEGRPTGADASVLSALPSGDLLAETDDTRAVLPIPSGDTPVPRSRASSLEPSIRAFLEVSLGLPIFGMEIEVLNLLLAPSHLLWSSLLLTSFSAALPFECVWAVLLVLRGRRQ